MKSRTDVPSTFMTSIGSKGVRRRSSCRMLWLNDWVWLRIIVFFSLRSFFVSFHGNCKNVLCCLSGCKLFVTVYVLMIFWSAVFSLLSIFSSFNVFCSILGLIVPLALCAILSSGFWTACGSGCMGLFPRNPFIWAAGLLSKGLLFTGGALLFVSASCCLDDIPSTDILKPSLSAFFRTSSPQFV